jgi:hypothetical protein
VEIIFHAHHAVISERMRARAERVVGKLAARLPRAVDAIVRVEQDGPDRRVEIVLHAPRRRPLIGSGRGRTTGPALAEAAANLSAQFSHTRRAPDRRRGSSA